MKSIYLFDGHSEIPGVVISPVLEPTSDNPSGIYGQIAVVDLNEAKNREMIRTHSLTCIPGDFIEIDYPKIVVFKKLKYRMIAAS
jgi:hypothetical protein